MDIVLDLLRGFVSTGKLTHFAFTLAIVLLAGVLLLGYRDRARVDLTDQLAALVAMFIGVVVGMIWEIVEFLSDWLLNTDLQPSNTDTMLKFLASDVAAVIAAVLATTVYCRWLNPRQRKSLGELAVWLADGPSRTLDRHGFAITVIFSVLVALAVAALWSAGRPVPGFPIG